jgi:dTDP-4-dehydrorhamnose reductase
MKKTRKKIALIGADGQLGSDLYKTLPLEFDVIPLILSDLDVTQLDSINTCLSQYNPEIILSTAGFHNVPYCEVDPQSTFSVNTIGTKYLTDWCFFHNCKLVFISTDYVFNGEKGEPYNEEDVPDPINTYGISKYAAELYIRHHLEDYLIIRTTGLYGENPCLGKPVANFFEMFIKLVENKEFVEFNGREICSPTYTWELANQITLMLKENLMGLYHVVNDGYCSWFEFGQAIIDEMGLTTQLQFIERADLPPLNISNTQPLKRPKFTALENQNLKNYGLFIMGSWRDALHKFIENRCNLGKYIL